MPESAELGGYGLDNNVNPYFVYRAFIVDNLHNKKNEVGVYRCNFQQKNAAYEQNLVDNTEENRHTYEHEDLSASDKALYNTFEEYEASNRQV